LPPPPQADSSALPALRPSLQRWSLDRENLTHRSACPHPVSTGFPLSRLEPHSHRAGFQLRPHPARASHQPRTTLRSSRTRDAPTLARAA
jgi:hypothetical protein